MLRALALAFGVFLTGSSLAHASIPKFKVPLVGSTIRVRISEGSSIVAVRGYDLRIGGERKLAAVSDRQSEWELRCEDGRIRARRDSGNGVGDSSLDLPE